MPPELILVDTSLLMVYNYIVKDNKKSSTIILASHFYRQTLPLVTYQWIKIVKLLHSRQG